MPHNALNKIDRHAPHTGLEQPVHFFDDGGFLINPEVWSEEFAAQLAIQDGLGTLDENHWRAIHYLRDRYLRLGAIPPVRHLCRGSGLTQEQLKSLFGSCYALWRLSGLPDPGQEVRNHMK
jgi:tRNA 2-thiouridine synthesizing protein E